jgi:hypothetical protein
VDGEVDGESKIARADRYLFAMALAFVTACSSGGLPDKALYAGLDRENYASGSRLTQGRLRARFPKGSPGAALAAYLREQGMTVEPERFARPEENAWTEGSGTTPFLVAAR